MDAVAYIRTRKRMCKTMSCDKCPLSGRNNGTEHYCGEFLLECTEKAVKAVEKWREEHPGKTRKDVLLKAFPNALLHDDGEPFVCAGDLGLVERCPEPNEVDCTACWNAEVE